jgi:hypothetical protein
MTPGVYVGLVVCAQNNGALCAATFDNVALPAPPGNVYASAQLSPGLQSGGVFTLQFQGVSDLNYTVETSTNLIDWSGIFTNALIDADGGIFTFTNTNATDPARFYRIVQ